MKYTICCAGQYRCGKDQAADHLQATVQSLPHFGAWKRASLARDIKRIFAENFGVSLEFIEEWKVRQVPPPGFADLLRNGLTKIGDGWRDLKPDIWLEKLFKGNDDNLIVSDCRYINEALAMRGLSDLPYMAGRTGVGVLIWRPGHENTKNTRSEQELMPFVTMLRDEPDGVVDHTRFPTVPFDLWLKNDGTLWDWHDKVARHVLPFAAHRFGFSPAN